MKVLLKDSGRLDFSVQIWDYIKSLCLKRVKGQSSLIIETSEYAMWWLKMKKINSAAEIRWKKKSTYKLVF